MDDAHGIDSLRELRDNAKAMRASPAFARWAEEVLGQVKMRYAEIRAPLKCMDEIPEREFMKGEMNGMEQAVRHWDLMIELLTQEIKELEEEAKDVQDHAQQATGSP